MPVVDPLGTATDVAAVAAVAAVRSNQGSVPPAAIGGPTYVGDVAQAP